MSSLFRKRTIARALSAYHKRRSTHILNILNIFSIINFVLFCFGPQKKALAVKSNRKRHHYRMHPIPSHKTRLDFMFSCTYSSPAFLVLFVDLLFILKKNGKYNRIKQQMILAHLCSLRTNLRNIRILFYVFYENLSSPFICYNLNKTSW